MRIPDIAKQYNLELKELYTFLDRHRDIKTVGLFGDAIADEDIQRVVKMFELELAQKTQEDRKKLEEIAQEKAEKERKQREKQKAIASILVTSGFNFDGFKIKKYSGYISGDDTIQINRNELYKGQGQHLCDSLVQIRIQALKELKEAAYDLGCNAVIGVDFDYMTFEPESISGTTHYYEPYVVCVTANGNAVIIEKE